MSYKNLTAYQKVFKMDMLCLEVAREFPVEEKYGLASPLLRSSRSVCAQTAEGYRKRTYTKFFIGRMTDVDEENSETGDWLDFTVACGYVTDRDVAKVRKSQVDIGKLVNPMIENPEKYGAA